MEQGSTDFLYALLADDDSDDRMLFCEAVADTGLKVDIRTVKDGVELMNYLLGTGIILPQVLFLDLNMPFKNGFQCLAEIRSYKAFEDMFIILYSTTARPSDIQLGFEKGANLFIKKPNSFTELTEILSRLFKLDFLNYKASQEDFIFK